jgi:hypothetical protein
MTQSIFQYKGSLASVLCKIGKPDRVVDHEEYELTRDLCFLLPKFSIAIEDRRRQTAEIIPSKLCQSVETTAIILPSF